MLACNNAVYLPYCAGHNLVISHFLPDQGRDCKTDPVYFACPPMYDFHMMAYVSRYIVFPRLERHYLRIVPYVCTY